MKNPTALLNRLKLRLVDDLTHNAIIKSTETKTNALLCRSCCVEYVEMQFDLQVDNLVLNNVKALQCPCCNDEVFSPEQIATINARLKSSRGSIKL